MCVSVHLQKNLLTINLGRNRNEDNRKLISKIYENAVMIIFFVCCVAKFDFAREKKEQNINIYDFGLNRKISMTVNLKESLWLSSKTADVKHLNNQSEPQCEFNYNNLKSIKIML